MMMSGNHFLLRSAGLLLLFFFFDFAFSQIMLLGLNKYYGIDDKPDVLINGSSMSMSGFNRKDIEHLTGLQVSNYSYEGVTVKDRHAMIDHFFNVYPEGIRTVVYEVNPILFSSFKSADNVYSIFYPYMDNKVIDQYIKQNAPRREYFANKIIRTKRYDSRLNRLIIRGLLNNYDNLKTNSLDSAVIEHLYLRKETINIGMEKSAMSMFENTMDLIESHNSDIILIMMPMYYMKLNTFNQDEYKLLVDYLENLCSSRDHIKFLDLNNDSLIFNPAFFSDPLHFNSSGQRQITKEICNLLTEN